MSLRELPSVEKLANTLSQSCTLPKPLIIGFIRREINTYRQQILAGTIVTSDEISANISIKLKEFAASKLQPVINGTGVLIHTNLGRSPLGTTAANALRDIATGYSNLEFNLPEGTRGKRAGYLESALACLLNAESATVVNNCAAALVIILQHLAKGDKNEVIVSRGELVEIGGGFRIPEILETSGAKLVEVGATNKTHLEDYRKAITDKTALILKVHRSNFYIGGFTDEPKVTELSELAHQHNIPLVEDIGSGAMMNTDELAPIDHEPTPQDALKNGIDLVCFSGDKLLGGPQAGIIAGNAQLVAGIKKEPFFRAIRCDKLILTVIQESIDEYLRTQSDPTKTDIPTLRNLSKSIENLTTRAQTVLSSIGPLSKADIQVTDSIATTGGGTMPKSQIPSIALTIKPIGISINKLSRLLRTNTPAIVGYTDNDTFKLDFRTIFDWQDEHVVNQLRHFLT